jgi:hypothetical protein
MTILFIPIVSTIGGIIIGAGTAYAFKEFKFDTQNYVCVNDTTKTATKTQLCCEHSPTIQTSSQNKLLMNKLSNIYDNHTKKEIETTYQALQLCVPAHVLERIPKNLWCDFKKAIDNSPKEYSFAAYYAVEFLKKYTFDEPNVIEWLCKQYDIGLDE